MLTEKFIKRVIFTIIKGSSLNPKQSFSYLANQYGGRFKSKVYDESTNFLLEVNDEGFDDALLLFVNTLTNPLLLQTNYINSYLNSVLNELSQEDKTEKHKNNNSYRQTYILKSLSLQQNAFHNNNYLNDLKNNVGILEGLILKYYKSQYTFGNMSLVIKGKLLTLYVILTR